MTSADYLADREARHPAIAAWCKLAINDFIRRMPDGVKASAVIHLDEGHVHMHILAVNIADPKLDANKLHIGKRKAAEVRAEHDDRLPTLPQPEPLSQPLKPKKPKPSRTPKTRAKRDAEYASALAEWEKSVAQIKAHNEAAQEDWAARNLVYRQEARAKAGKPKATLAYNAAMKQLQDDYYEAVGKPSGLLRDGPRQKRRSTKEHAQDKRRAAELAKSLDELITTEIELKRLKVEADLAAESVSKPLAELETKKRDLEGEAQTLAVEKSNLEKEHRRLTELILGYKRQEADLTQQKHELREKEEALAQHAKAISAKDAEATRKLSEVLKMAASLEEREAQSQARDAALTARESAVKLDYARAEERIIERVSELEGKETQLAAREVNLTAREEQVEAARIEIEETTAGMAALMDAVENDQIDLISSPKSPQRLHKVFIRLFMTRPEQQSPLQQLLGRFVNFLKRGQKEQAGPSYDSEGPNL